MIEAPATKRQALRWLTAVLLGIPVGLISMVLPFPGLVIGALALSWAAGRAPRSPAISGVLLSAGVAYLAMLLVADARCAAMTSAGRGCSPANDPFPYALLATIAAVTGVVIGLAHLARSRRGWRGGWGT